MKQPQAAAAEASMLLPPFLIVSWSSNIRGVFFGIGKVRSIGGSEFSDDTTRRGNKSSALSCEKKDKVDLVPL